MSQVSSTSTSSPNFETIFAAALKEYTKKTKKDIASHPLAAQIKSCGSPSAVLTVLQTQVQTFDPSESANQRWKMLLGPTVNVLYAFSTFLKNAIGPVNRETLIFPPAAAIFTGIGLLLQSVKDVRASQDVLVELFGRMEFFFKRLESYIKVRPTAAMTDIIVKIMVEVISILGVMTMEVKQGRIKKYLKRLFGIHHVEDGLQRLDELTQKKARMAQAETLTIAHPSDANVESGGDEAGLIHKGITEATVEMQLVSKHVNVLNRDESRKDLRKWISPPDPSSNFDTASEAHHAGTAAWCTTGNTFADWKTSGSLLWIYGKPGSGKTILSSVIIRDIEDMFNAGSAFLAYFYFDFKVTGKQDSHALISSLLDQLSNQSDQFRDVLRGLYSEHRNGLKSPHDESLLRCLKEMLTTAGSVPVYLVIDALDECSVDSGFPSSREKVLNLVEKLVKLPHTNLRLCITSLPEFDIRTTLEPLATQRLSLHDESGQRRDIIDYITFAVRSDKKMKRWRDEDKKMVIDKLTEKADGRFRWVFCQLEVLRHRFPNNLRAILEDFPESLDETYKRILKDINKSNQKEAHRLLQCLAVASRPLRVEELADILALDFNAGGIPKFNANWRWEDHEAAVLSACSSLVSVIIDDGSRVVQFSHFSVKEYLTSDRLASCTEDVSQFHIAVEPSHAILAEACLSALYCLDDRTYDDGVENIPLYRYAVKYWVAHTRVGHVELQIKDSLDCFFDMDKPHFSAYLRLAAGSNNLFKDSLESTGVLPPAAPLYLATRLGLTDLAKRLIAEQPQAVNFRGHMGSPLHLSVREGHFDMARLMLAHSVDINSRSADNSTPLHIALQMGHLEIGKWLLDSGADVNSQDKNGWTPLHLSAFQGLLEVCRTLLERNADVHLHNKSGDTPLHLAASEGHLEVVRMLLELYEEVNPQNYSGSTPFLRALERDKLDVTMLLLDHNADVRARDKSGNNPLHFTVYNGHVEATRILLSRKVDVNSQNKEGSTPLHRASEGRGGRNTDILRLLLEFGANVHVHDNHGNTPLHFAASKGHLEVARMLLELKVTVNSPNDEGSTPLHQALEGGREETSDIARLLLDNGADIHARDNRGNTPLHFATSLACLEVARRLLALKVDVNSLNKKGSTPLHQAVKCSRKGTPEIVRFFLENGADVRTRDESGNTPIHFAASEGHLEITRILIKFKADVNSLNKKGFTPLHQALKCCRGESTDISQILLDNGANRRVPDSRGNTPLHIAASHGQLEVARTLLRLKANVNALNSEGLAPLHQASIGRDERCSEVVRLLLDFGADVQIRSPSGNTPLHLAASDGRLEVARVLLERNAFVTSRDDDGCTPLLRASESGKIDVLRLLLDHNADAEVTDNSGDTPLHVATYEGYPDVVRLLLERKAEVDPVNYYGLTPLLQALLAWPHGNPGIARLLLVNGADVRPQDNFGNTPLHLAASDGHLEVSRILLELKAEVNSLNDDGYTPLHRALATCRSINPKVARLLLDNGADVRLCDNDGNTLLHLAASEGHLEVSRMLLELKVELNSQNDEGSTPLHVALQGRPDGNPVVARLLLDNGVDVHVQDNYGNTPLHLAAFEGHLEIARTLLELKAEVNSLNNEGSTPLHQASESRHDRDIDIVRLLLECGADVRVPNLNGMTASDVAHERENRQIVQLLSQHTTKGTDETGDGICV